MIGLVLAGLLPGCTPADRGGSECSAEKTCGWGETCRNGYCVTGRCATSAQCPIEHYCEGDACVPGCRTDGDCPPGTRCDVPLAECIDNACQDTQVDCAFREYCDTTTGSCYDAGEQFCRPCENDLECGEGNYCWANFCGVSCNDRECPAGFDCLEVRDDFGNVLAFQCVTYCPLYEDFL